MTPSKIIRETAEGTFLLKKDFSQESNWRSDHCYKFIYSLDGMINYQTNRNQINFNHQQFILFNPQDEHKQLAVEGKKFLIELNPIFLNQVSKSLNFVAQNDIQFASSIQKNCQVSNWVKFVLDYVVIEKNDIHSMELFLEHSFTQFALILLKNAVGTHTQDINVNSYKIISPQIYTTVCALKESYQYPWTLDQMAEVANLNKYQFAHFFKDIIGISPYSWLQIYRIIRSQEMLTKTTKTILKIAMDCGFSSVTVYNQLFKRLYGITPSTFRASIRK
ncbi:helix-turn-helix transcriptional regulator [Virgibacillus pantothenticus]|uniref:helix-turn-helix transcriptional regulator n=1 Tax=Virgibacillus pantothenticus TaxID=1473 RepID=UPI0020B2E579|nr:response regulator transcription factor [Virgibacillus pantothenticus]MEB5453641.1 helix-turn-helix transcriptional regulator [Virgibacillus pantothenticus]MEB5457894.1 helix-turn-helix transcriptional regulator [Virgibacillus pantothenticus]MEB5462004.1 helix-turn-helix transcriptional regulator [Virgibacillus pantothenticus]MEB5466189.1 helix-turn-helix transcriptional regulator [Virgibacillus pantothenticus]MEB5470477.1 helix-turn-helix transcriptional regulator [Virgibacillus pantothent